jgi:diguanylate cyclase (GGDEF)-like protein
MEIDVLSASVIFILFCLVVCLAIKVRGLKLANQVLKSLVSEDPLTRLQNRRGFDLAFDRFVGMLADSPVGSVRKAVASSMSVMMFDLDKFKDINDRLGHPCGDWYLREVAKILQSSLRPTDVVCRMGGDEFAVILLDTPDLKLQSLASDVRRKVGEIQLEDNIRASVSIGIATATTQDNAAFVIKLADSALYQVKENGRNQVALMGDGEVQFV